MLYPPVLGKCYYVTMNTKATHTGFLLLIALMIGAGIVAYPQLPDQVASHWNAAGNADGYSDKIWGVFLFPMFLASVYALYAAVPKIEPLKANLKAFRKPYNAFFLGLGVFITYLFGLAIAWNLGYHFNFGAAMLPACAALLWLIGSIMARAKRNWFVGIRTPWTLSSDKVWNATHKLGSQLFKVSAVLTLVGLFFGEYGFWFFIAPLVATAIITTAYSYFAYARL